ncbi:hypothetical protein GCM10023174_10650 [Chelativorans composti]|uniref:Uncharacterized protein n=1 Tax=Chelativorans composti TaxID=768533 RepID=A0ABW5DJG0_9HYPH
MRVDHKHNPETVEEKKILNFAYDVLSLVIVVAFVCVVAIYLPDIAAVR